MKMTIKAVMDAVGGVLHSDDETLRREVTGITWDSRKVKEGDIFLAMPGERVDGNDYIVAAVAAGAGMIICTKEPSLGTLAIAGEFVCPVTVVPNGLEAITNLAKAWRRQLRCVVIGVTGSTGKTSTKDFLLSVMQQRYKTVATAGNNNNELGVPYTVLRADADTEVLIVEMGMRGLGQIEASCKIASPGIGVVTNVGVCHMELLGSQENIAQAKGELIKALPATGLAVVNDDDPMTDCLLQKGDALRKGVRINRFGRSSRADVRADNVVIGEDGCATFTLLGGNRNAVKVPLSIPGEHNVMNALAAATVGNYLGIAPEQIAHGLHLAGGSGMRMEVTEHNGITVVNDAYNANPDSMKAALGTLSSMKCQGKRVAVLGDMGELGSNEQELHQQVGVAAAGSNLDMLLCVGTLAKSIAQGAADAGMSQNVLCFDTVDEAITALKRHLTQGDVVLVKASRFMGFERIVEEIAK